MAPIVEKVSDVHSILGEGPHWNETKQMLYFVDIEGKFIQKFDPATNKVSRLALKGKPSVIIPVQNAPDQLMISEDKNLELVKWEEGKEELTYLETLHTNIDEGKNTRWNDGKCDPIGRLWIGTMDLNRAPGGNRIAKEKRQGTFSSFSNRKLTKHLDNIGISNGIAVDLKHKKFYYTDSDDGEVGVFDFDVEKGTISNRQSLFNLPNNNIKGTPDGMTIDADGNIWVPAIFGGKILKIDPRKPGTLLESFDIPAQEPTSLAWGGPNLDELYITTASFPGPDGLMPGPHDGYLYRVRGLGARGVPASKFKL